MSKESTSKTPHFSAEQIEAAIAAAPERVDDPDSPYDPNDPVEVEKYWAGARLTLPGHHLPSQWRKKS